MRFVLGVGLAIITVATVVYVLETDRSLVQVTVGFILFFLPAVFISSFRSTASIFLLVACTGATGYLVVKGSYYDTALGIGLALLLGGSIAYWRIRHYQPFSRASFEQQATGNKDFRDG